MQPRVPYFGAEKDSLFASLNSHRDAIVWKAEGLGDEQLRRPMTPTGTTVLGLVKHLAFVEFGWFCETFGRPPEDFDTSDPEADMRIEPDETTAAIFDYYRRARTAADSVIEETGLEDTGTAWHGATVSMRWVLIHMLEETARHAGHVDIMRELLDGMTGDHRRV